MVIFIFGLVEKIIGAIVSPLLKVVKIVGDWIFRFLGGFLKQLFVWIFKLNLVVVLIVFLLPMTFLMYGALQFSRIFSFLFDLFPPSSYKFWESFITITKWIQGNGDISGGLNFWIFFLQIVVFILVFSLIIGTIVSLRRVLKDKVEYEGSTVGAFFFDFSRLFVFFFVILTIPLFFYVIKIISNFFIDLLHITQMSFVLLQESSQSSSSSNISLFNYWIDLFSLIFNPRNYSFVNQSFLEQTSYLKTDVILSYQNLYSNKIESSFVNRLHFLNPYKSIGLSTGILTSVYWEVYANSFQNPSLAFGGFSTITNSMNNNLDIGLFLRTFIYENGIKAFWDYGFNVDPPSISSAVSWFSIIFDPLMNGINILLGAFLTSLVIKGFFKWIFETVIQFSKYVFFIFIRAFFIYFAYWRSPFSSKADKLTAEYVLAIKVFFINTIILNFIPLFYVIIQILFSGLLKWLGWESIGSFLVIFLGIIKLSLVFELYNFLGEKVCDTFNVPFLVPFPPIHHLLVKFAESVKGVVGAAAGAATGGVAALALKGGKILSKKVGQVGSKVGSKVSGSVRGLGNKMKGKAANFINKQAAKEKDYGFFNWLKNEKIPDLHKEKKGKIIDKIESVSDKGLLASGHYQKNGLWYNSNGKMVQSKIEKNRKKYATQIRKHEMNGLNSRLQGKSERYVSDKQLRKDQIVFEKNNNKYLAGSGVGAQSSSMKEGKTNNKHNKNLLDNHNKKSVPQKFKNPLVPDKISKTQSQLEKFLRKQESDKQKEMRREQDRVNKHNSEDVKVKSSLNNEKLEDILNKNIKTQENIEKTIISNKESQEKIIDKLQKNENLSSEDLKNLKTTLEKTSSKDSLKNVNLENQEKTIELLKESLEKQNINKDKNILEKEVKSSVNESIFEKTNDKNAFEKVEINKEKTIIKEKEIIHGKEEKDNNSKIEKSSTEKEINNNSNEDNEKLKSQLEKEINKNNKIQNKETKNIKTELDKKDIIDHSFKDKEINNPKEINIPKEIKDSKIELKNNEDLQNEKVKVKNVNNKTDKNKITKNKTNKIKKSSTKK